MNPIPGDPPRHHPSEDLLLRHSAGRLPPIQALVVSTHLPFCAQCRGAVGLWDDIGGALLAGMAPDDMAADALSRTLARLDTSATPPAPDLSDAGRPAVELAGGVPIPASLQGLTRPRWRRLANTAREMSRKSTERPYISPSPPPKPAASASSFHWAIFAREACSRA
jgi:predicted ChrR family anti-sigma factor